VAGRYLKYVRDLSQSPWVIDDIRKGESSVQELIQEPINLLFMTKEAKFQSAGREDVDVRMLGPGRPFVLELINPKVIPEDLNVYTKLQDEINSSTKRIQVVQLMPVTREFSNLLKEGEETKKKTYSCIVYLSKEFTDHQPTINYLQSIKNLVLKQKTPVRVLHRRSLAVREKIIHSIAAEFIDNHWIRLKLVTQAGTYIKEFIHGDLGRTIPNLGILLGCEADILQLDVIDIDMKLPTFEEVQNSKKETIVDTSEDEVIHKDKKAKIDPNEESELLE